MNQFNFDKLLTLIRTIVGAILCIASLIFLWKGISGSGEIGLDFQFFSGKFSTTSAGFALLLAGIILLLPTRIPKDVNTIAPRSLGQMIVRIVFYIFIGLLPVLAWIGITTYINYTNSETAKNLIPMIGLYALMIEIPLLFWVVSVVSKFFKNVNKK